MKAIFAFFAAAMLLAGCQTTGNAPYTLSREEFDAGPAAGRTQYWFNIKNREKWAVTGRETIGRFQITKLACRPLACPSPTLAGYHIANSTTRSPDPQAIVAFANDHFSRTVADRDSPRKIRNGKRTAPSRIEKFNNFQSVIVFGSAEIDGVTEYITERHIFAGSLYILIWAKSLGELASKGALSEIESYFEIKDGGPRS